MTIRHMRIFIEVYQTENITQAARQLHMTQPAVSRAIQELESYYGILLFERMNRRLYITECGRSFYGHALHILETLELMDQELKNWDQLGTLRVGSSISIGSMLLPDLISSFQSEHRKVKIHARIANSYAIQNAILENQLDIGLIEGAVTEENLHSVPFGQDRMLLIVCPSHPLLRKKRVFLEDLMHYDLLLREPGSAGRTFLDHIFAVHGLLLTPIWESTSTQALIRAVSKGIGISILPETLVQDALAQKDVCSCPIQDEALIRDNHLVWHKNKYLSPIMKDFLQLCQEHACT